MKIVRRTNWSGGLGTHPRGTRMKGTSTGISTLQVSKPPNCQFICNKPCSTFPHATAWSCKIQCLFNVQLAVGPVVGTHTARLCQTAHLLQPVFPSKKRKSLLGWKEFCRRVLILSPWETYCKHQLSTSHAQIEKLHLLIQSWIQSPKHYIYFYISLFRRAERKQTNYACILSFQLLWAENSASCTVSCKPSSMDTVAAWVLSLPWWRSSAKIKAFLLRRAVP